MTNVHAVCAVTESRALTVDVAPHIATAWKAKAERLRIQWEDSERSLGDARESISRLERELDELREAHGRLEAEATTRIQEQIRQCDEANWYLGESRATHEAFRHQTRELIEQLAQARNEVEAMRRVVEAREEDVDVERARRKAVEADLRALQRHGERRSSARTHRPDMVGEIRAPDGLLLFRGCLPNVSLTGLAFVTDQPVDDVPDFVEVTLHVPGAGRPIEGIGRLAWREAIEGIQQWGCELLDLLPDSRKRLAEVLATAA